MKPIHPAILTLLLVTAPTRQLSAQGPCNPAFSSHLLAPDAGSDDEFGYSTAVSGDRILVGAYAHDHDYGAGPVTDSGAAYVFHWNGTTWVYEAELLCPDSALDLATDDKFGLSLALDGDWALIGAPLDDDSGFANSGSAFVFQRNTTTGIWTRFQELHASDPWLGGASDLPDWFGSATAIRGDRLVVGAYGHNHPAGPGGLVDCGAAYVFHWNGTTWGFETELLASDGRRDDEFGGSLSFDGTRLMVGALRHAHTANPLPTDWWGSVYVLRLVSGVWQEEQELPNPQPSSNYDHYGVSVSFDGSWAIVGALTETTSTGEYLGSAYTWELAAGTWTLREQLTPPDGEPSAIFPGPGFGVRTRVRGNFAIVTANEDLDGPATMKGSAYVYQRASGSASWTLQAKLHAPGQGNDDRFGLEPAIGDGIAVIGSPLHDTPPLVRSGAAYVFGLQPFTGVPFCSPDPDDPPSATRCPCANFGIATHGCENSMNALGAFLTAIGSTNPDNVELQACGMPSIATVASVFFQGSTSAITGIPFGDGVRCADGAIMRLGSKPTPGGSAHYPEFGNDSVSIRGGVTPGSADTRFYQVYYRNASPTFCPGGTFNATNAIAITW